jgi:hypothetical protein
MSFLLNDFSGRRWPIYSSKPPSHGETASLAQSSARAQRLANAGRLIKAWHARPFRQAAGMMSQYLRSFAIPAAACLLMMAATISARAESFKFPQDKPIFSVTLPDGWACTIDKDGDATCQAGGDARYQIQVMSAPAEVKDEASARSVLQQVLQMVNEKTKMTDAAIGKPYEYKNVNNIDFIGQQSHGLVKGTEIYVISLVFAPRKGTYYIVEFIGAGAPNEKVSNYVLNSITPIK